MKHSLSLDENVANTDKKSSVIALQNSGSFTRDV